MTNGQPQKSSTTWPDLAEGLYSFLTGRGAMIEYSFENMEVSVPSDTNENSPRARWHVNGTVRVRTHESAQAG